MCSLVAVPAILDAAGGGPKSTVNSGPTHLEQAAEHYNKGLKHRDRAWKYESQAAGAKEDKSRKKYLMKARKEYEKAIEQQLSATRKSPTFHEAHASLGYACRKVGNYDRALRAYDRSLELRPDYVQAIQYRAVAHLALGRTLETKAAYGRLFVRDPVLADGLLTEIEQWLERREGLSVGRRDSLVAWMKSKRATAREMGDSRGSSQSGW